MLTFANIRIAFVSSSSIYLWLLQPERMKKEPIPVVSSSRDALLIMVLYCKNNILNANTRACEVKNIHQRAKTKPYHRNRLEFYRKHKSHCRLVDM